MLIPLFIFLLSVILGIYLFMQQTSFGKSPADERLGRCIASPNYKNNAFQNISYTPALTEGVGYVTVLKEFIFNSKKDLKPKTKIPSIKTNLHALDKNKNCLVWFGHSSYFMQVKGKRVLVDPVFCGSASPLPNGTKAFEGSDVYSTEDIPEIDLLVITHDHWDHLDYNTIKKLKPKIKKIITGLGTAEHLEYWGIEPNLIIEKDWNESVQLEDGLTVHCTSARHFSGRGLKRNQALWMSFVLKTPHHSIFIGGDSGFDKHFAEIGEKYGPFDLAILENGQYDKKWRYIHMLPEEFCMAAKNINAKRILPVHSCKFMLSNHAWYEPLELASKNAEKENIQLITPLIGETVDIDNAQQTFKKWWRDYITV